MGTLKAIRMTESHIETCQFVINRPSIVNRNILPTWHPEKSLQFNFYAAKKIFEILYGGLLTHTKSYF